MVIVVATVSVNVVLAAAVVLDAVVAVVAAEDVELPTRDDDKFTAFSVGINNISHKIKRMYIIINLQLPFFR